jgi:hypothetical protein
MRPSKIARLPHLIREELNLRLQDNSRPSSILKWVNALPETKALLTVEFSGRPITKQNLSDWRFAGFRDWLLHQRANDFFQSLVDPGAPPAEISAATPTAAEDAAVPQPDRSPPNQVEPTPASPVLRSSTAVDGRITHHPPSTGDYLNKLLRWIILQYAATASVMAAEDDPRSKWNRLREFCADIARLRRSDLYSQFLDIQRDWLALEKENTIQQKEKQFQAWARREDILAKLKAEETPGGLTDEAIKEITQKLNLM